MAEIGQRVILETLLVDGKFPGEIIEISLIGLCTVKLDRQEIPVDSVLYYETRPEVVQSSLWQFCYPETIQPETI